MEIRDLYDENKVLTVGNIVKGEEVGNINWFTKEQIVELIKNNKFLPSHIEFYNDYLELV